MTPSPVWRSRHHPPNPPIWPPPPATPSPHWPRSRPLGARRSGRGASPHDQHQSALRHRSEAAGACHRCTRPCVQERTCVRFVLTASKRLVRPSWSIEPRSDLWSGEVRQAIVVATELALRAGPHSVARGSASEEGCRVPEHTEPVGNRGTRPLTHRVERRSVYQARPRLGGHVDLEPRSNPAHRRLSVIEQIGEVHQEHTARSLAVPRIGDVVDVAGERVELIVRWTSILDPRVHPIADR